MLPAGDILLGHGVIYFDNASGHCRGERRVVPSFTSRPEASVRSGYCTVRFHRSPFSRPGPLGQIIPIFKFRPAKGQRVLWACACRFRRGTECGRDLLRSDQRWLPFSRRGNVPGHVQ